MNQVSEQLLQSFAKALNRQGYGFQFSILKRVDKLVKEKKIEFGLDVCEFPVEVQRAGTRIDFVISRPRKRAGFVPLYVVAECKRANPRLSRWCFVRAPYTHGETSESFDRDSMIIEYLLRESKIRWRSFAREMFRSDNLYHLALDFRSNEAGDPSGETGEAIEKAATQVSRSLNGFIETLVREPQVLDIELPEDCTQVALLPVIFTTAELFVSDVDLSQAVLETGHVTPKSENIRKVSWLFYNYALSPGLKHSVDPTKRARSLPSLLQWGYVRTIPVVSPSGIEQFLVWASNNLDTREF